MHGSDTAVAALERAAALTVQSSVARAAQLAAVAGYVARARAALGPPPDDRHGLEAMDHAEGEHAVVAELAARLVLTETAASSLVALALTLTTRLPVTFGAMARGTIDEARAKVVVEQTELLSDAHAAVVDEAISPLLGPLNTAELRKRVKDEVEDVDREAVKRRAKKATADRHVRLKALADGMAELTICAPATDVVSAYNNIEALAKDKDRPGGRVDPHAGLLADGEAPCGPDGVPLDRRGQDAHRADTALDLLRQGLGDAAPSGCGPQIFVTFPAAIGLDDQPAQLDRTGAVPPAMVRELLKDERFRRVLFDPLTGHLVAVDGHSYPPGTLPDLSRDVVDAKGSPPPPQQDDSHSGGTAVEPTAPADASTGTRKGTGTGTGTGTRAAPPSPGPTPPVDRPVPHRSQTEVVRPVPVPPAPTPAPSPGAELLDPGEAPVSSAAPVTETPAAPVDTAPPVTETPAAPVDTAPPVTETPAAPVETTPPVLETPAAPVETTPPVLETPAAPVDDAPATAVGRPCPVAAAGGGPYDIAAAILRHVRARSRRCTAPGCRRPARQCDTDHRIPWPEGPTCPCNLAPLCRRHHLAKHRFGWEVRKASPDPANPSQHWTSPLGYEYVVPPEPLLPQTRSPALARERGVPSERWPEDDLDPDEPYRRHDWHSRVNARQAVVALECHARAHAPAPEPRSGWAGRYADDPPF